MGYAIGVGGLAATLPSQMKCWYFISGDPPESLKIGILTIFRNPRKSLLCQGMTFGQVREPRSHEVVVADVELGDTLMVKLVAPYLIQTAFILLQIQSNQT